MSGVIALSAWQAEWLIRGALAAASSEEVTPVFRAIKWTVGAGRVTVIATDRHRVHQLHVSIPDVEVSGEFIMPRQQAELLLRSWHAPSRRRRDQLVKLAWTDAEPLPDGFTGKIGRRYTGTVEFTILSDSTDDADRISHEGAQPRGNFPPLESLFDKFAEQADSDAPRAAQISLNPTFLAGTRWLRSGFGSLLFRMPAEAEMKHGPIYVANTEGTARGLIQPNLRGDQWKEYGSA